MSEIKKVANHFGRSLTSDEVCIVGFIPRTYDVLFYKFSYRVHMAYYLRFTRNIILTEKHFWRYQVTMLNVNIHLYIYILELPYVLKSKE